MAIRAPCHLITACSKTLTQGAQAGKAALLPFRSKANADGSYNESLLKRFVTVEALHKDGCNISVVQNNWIRGEASKKGIDA
jgi:hypothetical protein